jgi:hypothetical protein
MVTDGHVNERGGMDARLERPALAGSELDRGDPAVASSARGETLALVLEANVHACPDFSDRCMIAVYPPADLAGELAVPAGLSAADLHVTVDRLAPRPVTFGAISVVHGSARRDLPFTTSQAGQHPVLRHAGPRGDDRLNHAGRPPHDRRCPRDRPCGHLAGPGRSPVPGARRVAGTGATETLTRSRSEQPLGGTA